MIKHIWSILVQKSIIESQTNSLSLIDVMEELTVGINKVKSSNEKDSTINVPINYEIVSYLSRDREDIEPKIKIEIINPSNKILKVFEYPIAWEKGKQRMRVRMCINGLGVDEGGSYTFKVWLKEDKENYKIAAEIPLLVNIVNGPPPTVGKIIRQ